MEQARPTGQGEHVVVEGDSIVSIAASAGLLPDTLWNDPANSALKETRKDGEVLLPGDRLTVMEPRVKEEARATGKRYVFRRKGVPAKFTLVLLDEDGEPFASKRYELLVDGVKSSGTSDADGKIECLVDPRSRKGTLTIWLDEPGLPNPWTREIVLAALYPVEHPQGVQQRLANLGLYRGPFDGAMNVETRAALAAFQVEQGMTVTEEIDDATRAKLVEVHKV